MMIDNIQNIKQAYLIGIKGVGMTMLAQFLASRGVKIIGSDLSETFMTDKTLSRIGASVRSPYQAENIPAITDLIIYTSAATVDNNPEMAFIKNNPARFKNIPLLSYAQALAAVFNQYQGLAVCGSHGKTTVTAWLAYVLKRVKQSPTALVGAYVPQFKSSGLNGHSNLLIAEIDEYQNKMKYFKPWGVILNNIDYDHPDYFKTPSAYFKVFAEFVKKIPRSGFLVANALDPLVCRLLPLCRGRVITYAFFDQSQWLKSAMIKGVQSKTKYFNESGLQSKTTSFKDIQSETKFLKHIQSEISPWLKNLKIDLVASDYQLKNGRQFFSVNNQQGYSTSLLGRHNIANALAVLAVGQALDLKLSDLKQPLADFQGTARRAQLLGKYRDLPVFDDYGHHPTEIKATLSAFKETYPDKRLVVLFHPHTFTRTKVLFSQFIGSFKSADVLGILEIYGSAREKQGGISSRDLVKALRIAGRRQPTRYLANFDQAAAWLKKALRPGDLLLLIGAGDVFRVAERLPLRR